MLPLNTGFGTRGAVGEIQRGFPVVLGSSLCKVWACPWDAGLGLTGRDPRVGPGVCWLLGARCALGTDFGESVGDQLGGRWLSSVRMRMRSTLWRHPGSRPQRGFSVSLGPGLGSGSQCRQPCGNRGRGAGSPHLRPPQAFPGGPAPSGVDGRGWGEYMRFAGLPGWAGWDQHQLRWLRALVSSPAGLSRPFQGPPSSQQPPPSAALPSHASWASGPLPLPQALLHWDPLTHWGCPCPPMPAPSTPFFFPL